MAVVYTEQSICLDDYFFKYGFDEGKHDAVGLECMNIAVDILNKHLGPLNIRAHQILDSDSKYNNCRIYFTSDIADDLGDMDDDLMYDESVWGSHLRDVDVGVGMGWAVKVVRALQAASKEFEWECLDDLSKVIRCPQGELPLLIGQLQDESALRVFQWRISAVTV